MRHVASLACGMGARHEARVSAAGPGRRVVRGYDGADDRARTAARRSRRAPACAGRPDPGRAPAGAPAVGSLSGGRAGRAGAAPTGQPARGRGLSPRSSCVVGALAITVLGGIVTLTGGLLALAAIIGWATAWALRIGGGAFIVGRRRAWLAVALALGSIVLGQVGLWLYGLTEGGVLPLSTTWARSSGRSSRRRRSSPSSSPGWLRDDRRTRRRRALPAAHRGRLSRRHRRRRRVVGRRPPDAGAPPAPLVPALRRDVVDRRDPRTAGSTGSSSGSSAPTIRPRPTSTWSGRTRTTGSGPRAGAVRALLRGRAGPRRSPGQGRHLARQPDLGQVPHARWGSGPTTARARNGCTARSRTPITTATARTGSTSFGTCSGPRPQTVSAAGVSCSWRSRPNRAGRSSAGTASTQRRRSASPSAYTNT